MIFNADTLTIIFLAFLVICAVIIVFTEKLISAVIYMGVFSAIAAFVFLLLGAPDVALAEAVIGCTLATVIYLVAIKKFRIYTVYCYENDDDKDCQKNLEKVIEKLEEYLKSKELQLNIVHTDKPLTKLTEDDFSLVIEASKCLIVIKGNTKEQHTRDIAKLTSKIKFDGKTKLSFSEWIDT